MLRAQNLAFLGKELVINETVEELFSDRGRALFYSKTNSQSLTVFCYAENDEVDDVSALSRITMAYQEPSGVGQSVSFVFGQQGDINPLAPDQDVAVEAISSKFNEVLSKVQK